MATSTLRVAGLTGALSMTIGLALATMPFAAAAGVPPSVSAKEIVIGTTFTLHSKILGDDRQVNVWLPPDYETSKSAYPILYLLDGALDQDFQHIAGLAQLGWLSQTYQTMIVVGVQTRARRHELTARPTDARYLGAFPESGGAAQFRDFLTREIEPFVQARYRTNGRTALIGESLAGLFVVETFLNSPQSFDDYIAISPSLWWDDRALARSAGDILAKRKAGSGPRLYLAIGDEGGTQKDGVDRVVRALTAYDPKRSDWVYSDRSTTEGHDTIYHGAALDAFRRFFGLPSPYANAPNPWFLIEGASPPPAPPK